MPRRLAVPRVASRLARRFALLVGPMGAAFALATGVAAQPAGSDTPALALDWRAPDGCPDRAAIERGVDRLLGGVAVPRERRLAARADVSKTSAGYRLHLTTTRASGGPAGERTVDAPSCRALGDAAAVILALAIDPSQAAKVAAAAAAAPSAAPSPLEDDAGVVAEGRPSRPMAPSGPAPAPVDADAGAHDAGTTKDASAPPVKTVEKKEAPSAPRSASAADAGAPTPQRASTLFAVGVGAGADVGSLPNLDVALGAGFAFTPGPLRFALDLVYLPSSEAEVATSPSRGGRLWLASAELRGCYLVRGGPFEAGPCLLGEAGVLHGDGFGVRAAESATAPWLAVGAGGFGALRLIRALALRLTLDGVIPLTRPEFVVRALGSVHRPAPIVGRALAGVEVRF